MFKVIGRFLADVALYTVTLPIRILIIVAAMGAISYCTIRYGFDFGRDMWKAAYSSFMQTIKREAHWG